MKSLAKAFTVKSNSILNSLTTECYVHEAVDVDDIPNENIKADKPYKALWDTGATISMIDKHVAEELNLIPFKVGKIYHAKGAEDTNYHKVCIFLPNKTFYPNIVVAEGDLNSCDILIGMDIISQGDFSITNLNGKTVFSFQTPSTHRFDFVEEIGLNNKYSSIHIEWAKHGNNRCPCGSGKLYKNCHGKD